MSEIDRPLGPDDRVVFRVDEGPRGPIARRVFCAWRSQEHSASKLAG